MQSEINLRASRANVLSHNEKQEQNKKKNLKRRDSMKIEWTSVERGEKGKSEGGGIGKRAGIQNETDKIILSTKINISQSFPPIYKEEIKENITKKMEDH